LRGPFPSPANIWFLQSKNFAKDSRRRPIAITVFNHDAIYSTYEQSSSLTLLIMSETELISEEQMSRTSGSSFGLQPLKQVPNQSSISGVPANP
jgi:hypothetical protein